MKKYKKLLINIMVIFIILFNLFIPNAYAGPLQDIMNRAEGFVNNGENGGNVINNDALKEGSNTLYNVLLVIGRNSNIYPLSRVRGVIPANHIFKDKDNVVLKK